MNAEHLAQIENAHNNCLQCGYKYPRLIKYISDCIGKWRKDGCYYTEMKMFEDTILIILLRQQWVYSRTLYFQELIFTTVLPLKIITAVSSKILLTFVTEVLYYFSEKTCKNFVFTIRWHRLFTIQSKKIKKNRTLLIIKLARLPVKMTNMEVFVYTRSQCTNTSMIFHAIVKKDHYEVVQVALGTNAPPASFNMILKVYRLNLSAL